ncbi:MAG: hypothetical protein Q9164_000386 [Protoblastenia rupestris]
MSRTHFLWAVAASTALFLLLLVQNQSQRFPQLPTFSGNKQQLAGQNAPNSESPIRLTDVTITATEHAGGTATSTHKDYPLIDSLRVAIVETQGYHDEVAAAFMHSLGSQPEVELSVFKQAPRFGIEKLVEEFDLPRKLPPWQPWQDFISGPNSTKPYRPDLVVLSTCTWDATSDFVSSRLNSLLNEGKTYVLCVVHETDEWEEPKVEFESTIRPWAEAGKIDFITLSPQVATTLEVHGMKSWPREGDNRIERKIRHYAPVFPVKLPPLPTVNDEEYTQGNDSFALQGIFDPTRRDFDATFAHLQRFIDSRNIRFNKALPKSELRDHAKADQNAGSSLPYASNTHINVSNGERPEVKDSDSLPFESNIQLHLLGHGDIRPTVPDPLKPHVFFHESLPYPDFYDLLSQQSALLPAFSSDHYLWMKASSSIAASLIGGTPLVANKKILHAYSYLSEDAVYLQREGESEFDVIQRMLESPRSWRLEKQRRVRKRAAEVVEENVLKVKTWITEAKSQIGRFD